MKREISLIGFCLLFAALGFGQNENSKSLNLTTGLGMHSGSPEIGIGTFSAIGYQKGLMKDRIRVNPYYLNGTIWGFLITDIPDTYYSISGAGLNVYADLVRNDRIGLFFGAGGLASFSRGIIGTGGMPSSRLDNSKYFINGYLSGMITAGLRAKTKKGNLAWIIRPMNIYFGTQGTVMYNFQFGVELFIKNRQTYTDGPGYKI